MSSRQPPRSRARDPRPTTPRIHGFYGRIATIDEIARHLHARVDVREILGLLAEHAGRVMSFDRLDVVLWDDNRVDYTLYNLRGDVIAGADAQVEVMIGPLSTLSTRVLSAREPTVLASSEPGLRAALGVPLMIDGDALGTIEFRSHAADTYDSEDLKIAGMLALPLTTSIRNAALYDRERRRSHKMQALQRVGAAATTNLDRDILLEVACRQISAEFGYYKVNLATVDAGHVRIAPRHRLFYGRTLPADQPFDLIPLSERSLMTTAANEQRTVHAADVTADPNYFPEPGTRTRSEVAVPIVWRGVTYGLLDVQSERLGAFSEEDLQMLVLLANQLAAGLENCRLYDQVNSLLEAYVPATVARRMRADRVRPVVGGERQQISVLFADLRGFTGYAESHDAAVLVETLNTYLEIAAEEIADCGGTLDKFMGDAAMAFFNAPESQPDHALRAVRAALRIQQRMARLPVADRLEFGIGVNTGEAVVGNIGASTILNYTAIGDAVNIAKRLEERAAGGQVLISADTYAQVEGLVRAELVGALDLHNRRRQVQAYALRGLMQGPR